MAKSYKKAQRRADLALPLADQMSMADRKKRKAKALAGITTRKKAAPKRKPKSTKVNTVGGVAQLLKSRGKLPK